MCKVQHLGAGQTFWIHQCKDVILIKLLLLHLEKTSFSVVGSFKRWKWMYTQNTLHCSYFYCSTLFNAASDANQCSILRVFLIRRDVAIHRSVSVGKDVLGRLRLLNFQVDLQRCRYASVRVGNNVNIFESRFSVRSTRTCLLAPIHRLLVENTVEMALLVETYSLNGGN